MASILRCVTTKFRVNNFRNARIKVFKGYLTKQKWKPQYQQHRHLNVHENIAYTILKDGGISVPNFGVAKQKSEAREIAAKLNTKDIVLKAQVLAGGRGVGHFKNGLKGGVRMVETPEQAEEIAGKMLGQLLVTKQTGAAGRICNAVMITQRKYPRKEYYFSVLMERSFGGPVIIASSQGGVSIEDVAATNPEAIVYEPINIIKGIQKDQADRICEKVGMKGKGKEQTSAMLMKMYDVFVKKDALLIEVNPYAEDSNGEFFVLDCKCRFDDNAAFRQKALHALRDWTQEDEKEVAAAKFDLNYIALDGNIGCMVNGAGLAMATMDIIKLHGGEPANFLDVGGGATAKSILEAFKIITADPKVHAILVNIFGGIMRCDLIAEGLIAAAKELKMKIPVVVRLLGTNVEEAKALIANAALKIIPVDNLDEAAEIVVKISTIVKLSREAKLDVNFEIPI